jgi:hypothetical protein
MAQANPGTEAELMPKNRQVYTYVYYTMFKDAAWRVHRLISVD